MGEGEGTELVSYSERLRDLRCRAGLARRYRELSGRPVVSPPASKVPQNLTSVSMSSNKVPDNEALSNGTSNSQKQYFPATGLVPAFFRLPRLGQRCLTTVDKP